MWTTYVLTISPFSNPWQNHNKQMNIWEFINHSNHNKQMNNKIYSNTNSWKILQEESLWQVDFDNLYF